MMNKNTVGAVEIGWRGAAGALGLGLMLAASGSFAQSSTMAPAAPPAGPAMRGAPMQPGSHERGIDGLIAHLHDSLKITPQQESAWQSVATVMRENAEELTQLSKKRSEQAKTASAVDDLKSYVEISEAHARGTKKLLPAFETLYQSMSPEQQHLADEEFRGHFRNHHHRAQP
jgi:protein CpxP